MHLILQSCFKHEYLKEVLTEFSRTFLRKSLILSIITPQCYLWNYTSFISVFDSLRKNTWRYDSTRLHKTGANWAFELTTIPQTISHIIKKLFKLAFSLENHCFFPVTNLIFHGEETTQGIINDNYCNLCHKKKKIIMNSLWGLCFNKLFLMFTRKGKILLLFFQDTFKESL